MAIQGGSDDISDVFDSLDQRRRDAVVRVNDDGCTGTLITPRLVLTALHCAGTNVRVTFGPDNAAEPTPPPADQPPAPLILAMRALRHPDYMGEDCTTALCALDIALLVLSERVEHGPTGIARTPNYPAEPAELALDIPYDSDVDGDPMRVIGFGAIGSNRCGLGDDPPDGSCPAPILRQGRSSPADEIDNHHLWLADEFTRGGDSGGAIAEGSDPSRASSPLRLAAVISGGSGDRTAGIPVFRPSTRAWLESVTTGPSALLMPGVWLGPTDIPPYPERPIPSMVDRDPDGDGLYTEHDNCPLIFNPEQRDTNLDGFGDSVPAALAPARSPLRASCVGSSALEIDCRTADIDQDGVADPCDVCPEHPDSGQQDSDGDGMGDACDHDADLDGIPDDLDNCPTYNPDQANCNADTERVFGSRVRGDICDANPCPRVEAETSLRETTSEVELDSGGIVGTGVSADRASYGTIETHFRFCPCSAAMLNDGRTRSVCSDPAGDNCEMSVRLDNDEEPGNWRRMTLAYGGQPATSTPRMVVAYREPPVLGSLRSDSFRADWSFQRDGADYLTGGGRALRSVIWSRAAEYAFPAAIDGIPRSGCNVVRSSFCPALRGDPNSHYWSGEVRRTTARRTLPPALDEVLGPVLFPQDGCPECDAAFPRPFFGYPSCPVELCDPDVFARFSGAELDVTARLSSRLRRAMAEGFKWIAADDPPSRLLHLPARMVALDPATGMPRHVVYAALDVLDVYPPGNPPIDLPPDGDPPSPPSDGPPIPPDGPPIPLASERSSAERRGSAPDLTSAAWILRGTARALYRVGGLDGSGRAAETFTRLHLGTMEQRETTVRGAAPGPVLAAALHPWLNRALVLDRTDHGTTTRLLWIDLITGESVVLASVSAHRTSVFDRYDLVGLEEGSFALLASSARASRHVVVTLRVRTSPLGRWRLSAERVAHGSGRVVARPYATSRGLSIPVSRRAAPWQPVGLPYSELRSARWSDVEDCL